MQSAKRPLFQAAIIALFPFMMCKVGFGQGSAAQSQTLFTYGKYAVTASEFLAAFEKNRPEGNVRKAKEEYLELYTHYKLKVQEAYARRMDTLPAQREELYGYREQIAGNYLAKMAGIDSLTRLSAKRATTDRLVNHLSFPFEPSDPTSRKQALQEASEARKRLMGGTKLETLLAEMEVPDPEDAPNGSLGWVTAFTLPYLFEDAVYQTPVGTWSAPVAASTAYHLFSAERERPAAGKLKLAQILIAVSSSASREEQSRAKNLADSLHAALLAGASFEDLALRFSNDRTSYATGGLLPEFGVGEYEAAFETAAFRMEKPGEISYPFRTVYGWHILKLVARIPIPRPDDPDYLASLRQRISASEWANANEKAFYQRQLKKLNYVEYPFNKAQLWRLTDSSLQNRPWKESSLSSGTPLFSLAGKKTTVENWLFYNKALGTPESRDYETRWEDYKLQSVATHFRDNLEKYEPGFKAQLREFTDASLLFGIMDEEVWSKAAADTAGLANHYNRHRDKYTWGPGGNALLITALDSISAIEYVQKLQENETNWRLIAADMSNRLLVDSGRFETEQIMAGRENEKMPARGATSITRNPSDGTFSLAYVLKTLPGGGLRSFEEARGWVISDYQQELEKKWMEELKKKYPVKLNPTVWNQVLSRP